MSDGLIVYDGTVYRLRSDLMTDLLTRGVIVRDQEDPSLFDLAPEHLIDEIESLVTVVDRRSGADARGEGDDVEKQRMLAVRYQHRDGQGGR